MIQKFKKRLKKKMGILRMAGSQMIQNDSFIYSHIYFIIRSTFIVSNMLDLMKIFYRCDVEQSLGVTFP